MKSDYTNKELREKLSMKQIIIKFLINKLRSHDHRYWLWRGLLTPFINIKYTEKVYYNIADWIYSQEEGRWVHYYDFTDIFYLHGIVYLYTTRPSFWIGNGGKNIDGLLQWIKTETEIPECREIKIIEDAESARARIFTRLNLRALDY